MVSLRTLGIAIVISALLTAIASKYYFPSIEFKTEVIEKEVVKKDIVTIVKEIVRPDGSKETTTTTTDKSKETRDTKETHLVQSKQSKYLFTAGAIANNFSNLDKPDYQVGAAVRVLGPAFIGVSYKTGSQSQYGVFVTVEY